MSSALPRRSDVQRAAAELGAVLVQGTLRDAFAAAGDFGLLGAHLPRELGGQGLDGASLAETWEGVGEGCADAGRLFAMAAHACAVAAPIARHGSEAQRARFLPGLLDGSRIGAHAASEAEAGSDTMAMQARAEREGEGYRLSGTKLFVSNGSEADLFLVFASLEGEPTAFVVERSTPDLTVGAPMEKMGLHAASLTSVYLEGCFVPSDARLGAGPVFHTAMLYERTLILAPQVGAMRAQLERSIRYARERRQFGRPIGKNQLVAARVVEMYERYVLARGLVRDAATALVDGSLTPALACLVKLRVSEWALAHHLDALRTHGGSGYLEETGLPGAVRDAVAGVLYSGTSDLQRVIIAAHLGL